MEGGNFDSNPLSFSDTGQWKIIVSLRNDGIMAVFKNTIDPLEKPIVFLDRHWEPDESHLLENIESAVYDNPRMLDDFATHVVIDTPKSLWIPVLNTEDDEFDPKYFTEVFPAAEEDVSADFSGDEVALYSLVPGLNSFLQRTLPGSKISSAISILKEYFGNAGKRTKDETSPERIYIHIPSVRQGSGISNGENQQVSRKYRTADLFAFRNDEFLMGSTRRWRDMADLAYDIILTCHSYNLNPGDVELKIYSERESGERLQKILEGFIGDISIRPLPELTLGSGFPMAASISVK